MIVLDKPKLAFLLRGRTITVTVPHDRFRRGRSYSVSTAHNRPATCTATVVGIKVTTSGRELQIIQNRDSQDVYMARVGRGFAANAKASAGREAEMEEHGYTSRLGQALGCEDAPVIEPALQAKYSKEARERDQALKQTEKRREYLRSLTIRMREAERRGDGEEFARIRREMASIEDQLRKDAA